MKQKRQSPSAASNRVYPFTAIVGQEEMKLALLLNVIDPLIGGVLITGHRGTGKSTAVRALADLLPQMWKVAGCPYGCDPADAENLCTDCSQKFEAVGKLPRTRVEVPIVNLPLGATEDRVCGTIDIEKALKEGVKAFEPGLLARANRGFLYIDEVNLLEDHLVDLLLDVAVTGRNMVEREGISLEHPARFVLVGSSNPEEGELRPQLVDRFGLCAEVQTLNDPAKRLEIVEQREAFDRNPARFRSSVESEQENLRRKLARARTNSGQVSISKKLLRSIAVLCMELGIEGHRGELTIVRSVRALAAFEGRRVASDDDIRRVAPMSLRHRLRRDPIEPTGSGSARIEQALATAFPQAESDTKQSKRSNQAEVGSGHKPRESSNGNNAHRDHSERPSPAPVEVQLPDHLLPIKGNSSSRRQPQRQSAQKRQSANRGSYNFRGGRYSRAVANRPPEGRIAIDATLRAIVGSSGFNPEHPDAKSTCLPALNPDVLRFKAFKRKQGTLFIMAIDTSGSMAVNRIDVAKGAVVWLLNSAYLSRDRIALVSFRGEVAEELLPPSQSISRARRILNELPMGGPTPLASALACALNIATRAKRQSTEKVVLMLLTDGRANVALRKEVGVNSNSNEIEENDEVEQLGEALRSGGVTSIVVDTQSRFTSDGKAQLIASQLNARYVHLSPGDAGYERIFENHS